MSTADKIKVMQAFLEGEEIEFRINEGDWQPNVNPVWNWGIYDYRVKEKDYSLDIPWELIEGEWKWAAMDENGRVYIYTEKPKLTSDMWVFSEGDYSKYPLKISTPDTKYWRSTLTKRSEGV